MRRTTKAPTTMSPTTIAPTTMRRTTKAPTTMVHTTIAPTTMRRTTKAPTKPKTCNGIIDNPDYCANVAPYCSSLNPKTRAAARKNCPVACNTCDTNSMEPSWFQEDLAESKKCPTYCNNPSDGHAKGSFLAKKSRCVKQKNSCFDCNVCRWLKDNDFTPTTIAPTTMRRTTMAPTTIAPTTMRRTTKAPTTMAPTTMAPTTMRRTTMVPTTIAPTTMRRTTKAPTKPKTCNGKIDDPNECKDVVESHCSHPFVGELVRRLCPVVCNTCPTTQ